MKGLGISTKAQSDNLSEETPSKLVPGFVGKTVTRITQGNNSCCYNCCLCRAAYAIDYEVDLKTYYKLYWIMEIFLLPHAQDISFFSPNLSLDKFLDMKDVFLTPSAKLK